MLVVAQEDKITVNIATAQKGELMICTNLFISIKFKVGVFIGHKKQILVQKNLFI